MEPRQREYVERRHYVDEVQSLVDTLIAEGRQEGLDRDALDKRLWETIDGHEWVIYTTYHYDVLRHSPNNGAAIEQWGPDGVVDASRLRTDRLAFGALYADVSDRLWERVEECDCGGEDDCEDCGGLGWVDSEAGEYGGVWVDGITRPDLTRTLRPRRSPSQPPCPPIIRDLGKRFPAVTDGGPCDAEAHLYLCTRPAGHDGPHVAHVPDGSACAQWPAGDEEVALCDAEWNGIACMEPAGHDGPHIAQWADDDEEAAR